MAKASSTSIPRYCTVLSSFVAEQELDGTQVPCLLVYMSRFRPPHRMRAVTLRIKPDARHPPLDDTAILPRRKMRLACTGKQIIPFTEPAMSNPGTDSIPRLVGSSNCTGRPAFRCTMIARSRTLPEIATSATEIATRSQARNLLSIARLNSARSRTAPDICRRVRMAQTSFGFNGGFLTDNAARVPARHSLSPKSPPQRSTFKQVESTSRSDYSDG